MKSKSFKVIGVLLSLVGIIFGIVLGFACQIPTYSVWYDSHKEYAFNTGLMIETWLFFDLLALFFGWLGSVLEKLENIERTICENSVTSNSTGGYFQSVVNNISRYTSTGATNAPTNSAATQPSQAPRAPSNAVPGPNEWKCSKCGRVNASYVGTCGCGEPRFKNQ